MANGYEIGHHKDNSPDICIPLAKQNIWIEAVTPTPGDPSKADSVPVVKYGVAQRVPDEQMTLRYCSVIRDKYFNKYFKHLNDKIIDPNDCYLIALNGCLMPWNGSDYEPPRIVRAILPFGWPVVTLDTKSSKIVNRSNQFRTNLDKTSGNKVDTNIFTKPEYAHLSAVMFSNVDVANPTSIMGEDFIIVHNPLAKNPLPANFPNIGREFKAEIMENTITVFPRSI
jgi:type I restriction enzyme S subunit